MSLQSATFWRRRQFAKASINATRKPVEPKQRSEATVARFSELFGTKRSEVRKSDG